VPLGQLSKSEQDNENKNGPSPKNTPRCRKGGIVLGKTLHWNLKNCQEVACSDQENALLDKTHIRCRVTSSILQRARTHFVGKENNGRRPYPARTAQQGTHRITKRSNEH
jgi:hypothetical protein